MVGRSSTRSSDKSEDLDRPLKRPGKGELKICENFHKGVIDGKPTEDPALLGRLKAAEGLEK